MNAPKLKLTNHHIHNSSCFKAARVNFLNEIPKLGSTNDRNWWGGKTTTTTKNIKKPQKTVINTQMWTKNSPNTSKNLSRNYILGVVSNPDL